MTQDFTSDPTTIGAQDAAMSRAPRRGSGFAIRDGVRAARVTDRRIDARVAPATHRAGFTPHVARPVRGRFAATTIKTQTAQEA
ncbi:hypothetical protein [Brevundimonas sp.]|jgi:hypothetical protein|uniref:hypothetical protein n=1 Tax=Brevundimonas sp. TaxID=1871086 RepID=UPI0037BF5067